MVSDTAANYLDKADEALAGAERELALNAANNAANRAYYAAFLAAVAALWREGIRPRARIGGRPYHTARCGVSGVVDLSIAANGILPRSAVCWRTYGTGGFRPTMMTHR